MYWALAILGFLLFNVILAYVPVMLIVGYNLRPKKQEDELRERYLADEISTEEFVARMDERYEQLGHVPLN